MVVDFSKIDLREPPMLILKNTTDVPIGVLGYAMNITADIKYDEASVIEFNLPAQVDGEPTPYYDAVIGMRIVEYRPVYPCESQRDRRWREEDKGVQGVFP